MRDLVRREMEDGALGIGSSLIYAPDAFNTVEDLVELARVAARHRGTYITHMRSEGDRLLEAVDETIRVAREAGIPAEIYHLKAAGEANWPKLEQVIEKVETARREGLRITADMYTYTAGASGFDACLPPWSREGGWGKVFERIRDGETRARMLKEMREPCPRVGEPLPAGRLARSGSTLVAFRNEALKPLTGRDPRRGGGGAGPEPRGHDPRPRARRRVADRCRLLPDVGGERAAADPPAVGLVRVRRRLDGPGGRLPEVLDPSAGLRQLRAPPRPLRARREARPARGGDPAADLDAGRAPRPRTAGPARARPLRGRGRLRPGGSGRPGHVREPAAVRRGSAARPRQRRSRCCATASSPGRCRGGPSGGRGALPRHQGGPPP